MDTTTPGRDPWFDNIKMTLVTLVVVGHAWTLLPDNLVDRWTYDFLYSWHMPAFVLVTGYLSRSFSWTPRRLAALVRTVAVPYVLFEAALAWFRYEVGGVELRELFADPHWPMWYLSALFFWRLMAPAFRRPPAWAALSLAVLISLAAGLWATNILDNARIFGFLPFFVLGLRLEARHWRLLRTRWAAAVGVVTMLGLLVLTRFTDSWIATEWFYYRSRYDALDPHDLRASLIRLTLLGVGLAGAAACFALVPRARGWFSRLGAATLVVYLFHGFFVLSARYQGLEGWTAGHPVVAFPVVTVAAVLLATALAAPPVAARLHPLVDPLGHWRRGHPPAVPVSAAADPRGMSPGRLS